MNIARSVPGVMRHVLTMMLLAGSLGAACGVHAEAKIDPQALDELLRVKVRTVQHMALNPMLVRATLHQNQQQLPLEEIKQRDGQWRGSKELTPFKQSLQSNKPGRFLKGTVTRLASLNEAFLTDNQGANVAAYPATSDYWQGDEKKWSAAFNGGKGQVFIGDLELDDSTQTYAVQISAPVLDRGETIGVLVVGVTFSYVESKER